MAGRRQASFGPARVVEACAHWAERHPRRGCAVGARKGKVAEAFRGRRMVRCRCENRTVRKPQSQSPLPLPLPLPLQLQLLLKLPLLLKWQLQ